MIKGYLRVMVLKELMNSSQSGYSLISRMKEETGKKPSSGSMYPLLNDLLEKGLIRVREEGRSKVYSITGKGRDMISSLMREKESLMVMQSELVRLCTGKSCKQHFSNMQEMMEKLNKRGDLLVRNIDVWADFRASVFRFLVSDAAGKREKEIRQILKEATRRIEDLAREGR